MKPGPDQALSQLWAVAVATVETAMRIALYNALTDLLKGASVIMQTNS